MYIYLTLADIAGIQGIATYKHEVVIAYVAAPDGTKAMVKKRLSETMRVNVIKETEVVTTASFASCFIFKEKKMNKPFPCHQMVYVNNRASLQSPDVNRQFFFIEKQHETEEEILGELKHQFFTKALSKLPIPVHDDWREYVWDGVSEYFHEVEMFGNLPYKRIYALDIPELSKLSNLVELSHKSFEFKTKFGRLPNLKAVLSVSDINGFDFKDLQKFLGNIGGPKVIEEMPSERQDGFMKAYEALKSEKYETIMSHVDFWYTTSIKKVGVMIRNAKTNPEKDRIRQIFAKGWEFFSNRVLLPEEKDLRRPFIGNFNRIYKEKAEAIKNNDFKPVIKLLNEISYDEVRIGAEEMAKVCSKAMLSEEEYRAHEDYYMSEIDHIRRSHKEFPTISNQFNKDYFWEIIDMGEPRAWMVGYETNCCQHLGSVGGACVEYAAKNPATSGILRITKKDAVVAQSFVWLTSFRGTGNRGMVFDNIETLRSKVDNSIMSIYEDVANHIERYKDLFRIETLTIGNGYTDANLGAYARAKSGDANFGSIPPSLKYSDAKSTQSVLREFKINRKSNF